MKLMDLFEDRKYTEEAGEPPHKHTYWIYSDEGGDGRTTSTSAGPKHTHKIFKYVVQFIGWKNGDPDPQENAPGNEKLGHTHKVINDKWPEWTQVDD